MTQLEAERLTTSEDCNVRCQLKRTQLGDPLIWAWGREAHARQLPNDFRCQASISIFENKQRLEAFKDHILSRTLESC
jgi:hypothetical protein